MQQSLIGKIVKILVSNEIIRPPVIVDGLIDYQPSSGVFRVRFSWHGLTVYVTYSESVIERAINKNDVLIY